IGNAEAVWALLIGYLRLLSAASAEVVEFIADGAEWIWKRVELLRTLAEIPAAKVVEVMDFYHASQYLSETIATCRTMPKAQRHALYKRLRHALRHQTDGVEVVQPTFRTEVLVLVNFLSVKPHIPLAQELQQVQVLVGQIEPEEPLRRDVEHMNPHKVVEDPPCGGGLYGFAFLVRKGGLVLRERVTDAILSGRIDMH